MRLGQCYLYQAVRQKLGMRDGDEVVNEESLPLPTGSPQAYQDHSARQADFAGGGKDSSCPMAVSQIAGGLGAGGLGAAASVVKPRRVPVECGEMPFVIRRDASWLYRGSLIGRKELVCLFASVLKREPDGSFWLETPAERGSIEVEDAPFLAVELDWSGDGDNQVLSFRTNVDQIVAAGPEHPIRVSQDVMTCEPTPYITIRPGKGRWPIEARISRAVYYELVALAVPRVIDGCEMLGVWSCGCFFCLGELPPPDEEP